MTNVNFKDLDGAAEQLEEDIRNGAVGLKVWKNLGTTEKDPSGKRIPVDDPRLKPVWAVAAKIQNSRADPYSRPQTALRSHGQVQRTLAGTAAPAEPVSGSTDLPWEQLIANSTTLFASNPQTMFIIAHMGWMAHDLAALGEPPR